MSSRISLTSQVYVGRIMKRSWLVPIAFLMSASASCQPFGPPEPKTAYLLLAQIGGFDTREQVLNNLKKDDKLARDFETLGVSVEEIGNKSFVITRSTCCGGPGEWSIGAFVPPNIDADIGDVVEIRHSQEEVGEHAMFNVVVGVRAKPGPSGDLTGTACRWVPDNERLWLRNIYCEGLEQDGWQEFGKGVRHEWRKLLP